MHRSYSLDELATQINAEVFAEKAVEIHRLSTLSDAQSGDLAFLANPSYKQQLVATRASAVIVRREDLPSCPCAALVVDNPYLAYAQISHLFAKPKRSSAIHPTAVIGDDVVLGEHVFIGAHVVIGCRSVIGDDVVIGENTVIGEDVVVGHTSQLAPNVTVYDAVKIGKRNIIHASAVIGADGFGFANAKGQWKKIAQLGSVITGDDVEIGAATTIDRGALSDTILEDGVKLDNLIQIAHNVKIGAHTAIAGCTGIAGSTVIGKYCTIAGGVGIVGHIQIADRVHITGMTMVSKSIHESGVYSSGMIFMPDAQWKKSSARFRQLDDLAKRIQKLEKITKQEN